MAMTMWGLDRVHACVLCGEPPNDDEWTRWIAMSRERIGAVQRVLVETHDGGGPNAKQRKALADVMKGQDVRVAVLSDSTIVRGIVTALAWLGVPQRAFGMDHYQAAAIYLGLTAIELDLVMSELPRLRHDAGFFDWDRATGS